MCAGRCRWCRHIYIPPLPLDPRYCHYNTNQERLYHCQKSAGISGKISHSLPSLCTLCFWLRYNFFLWYWKTENHETSKRIRSAVKLASNLHLPCIKMVFLPSIAWASWQLFTLNLQLCSCWKDASHKPFMLFSFLKSSLTNEHMEEFKNEAANRKIWLPSSSRYHQTNYNWHACRNW